jgi:hypothetical protein
LFYIASKFTTHVRLGVGRVVNFIMKDTILHGNQADHIQLYLECYQFPVQTPGL